MDASTIYGSTNEEMRAARTLTDGLLQVRTGSGEDTCTNGQANEGLNCLLPDFTNSDGDQQVYAGNNNYYSISIIYS